MAVVGRVGCRQEVVEVDVASSTASLSASPPSFASLLQTLTSHLPIPTRIPIPIAKIRIPIDFKNEIYHIGWKLHCSNIRRGMGITRGWLPIAGTPDLKRCQQDCEKSGGIGINSMKVEMFSDLTEQRIQPAAASMKLSAAGWCYGWWFSIIFLSWGGWLVL
ncbi:hypothetical protein RJ639_007601 [Escallonia herrerae]|uniref:Uncharacterized protein n=1 Tax=Escallonia herrerae TaxID=1293975 RepID=A0AA89AWW1_9ASTE|nr:hypothetical protein RJ639_007601 [Escallonia herrerae]